MLVNAILIIENIFKIHIFALLFVLSMLFPLFILSFILFIIQGSVVLPWEMVDTGRYIILFLSFSITVITWALSLKYLHIDNLRKLLGIS